jgi:magnesium transporter
MNFKFMPELEWRYGYPVVVTCMAAMCVYLYYRFKRSGWL